MWHQHGEIDRARIPTLTDAMYDLGKKELAQQCVPAQDCSDIGTRSYLNVQGTWRNSCTCTKQIHLTWGEQSSWLDTWCTCILWEPRCPQNRWFGKLGKKPALQAWKADFPLPIWSRPCGRKTFPTRIMWDHPPIWQRTTAEKLEGMLRKNNLWVPTRCSSASAAPSAPQTTRVCSSTDISGIFNFITYLNVLHTTI